MRAAALSAGVAAIALLPISVQAQTTESAAYAVAKNSQSTEGTLKFIEAYPQSPLGLELVQALPEDLQKDVCVSLPESLPIDDALRLERELVREVSASADTLEGVQAFLEKRQPVWKDG